LTCAGNKEVWRENAKEIIDGEKMKECTFQPNIKPSNMSQMSGRKSSRVTFKDGGDKCVELYEKAKQESIRRALKTDKKT
jgi:hypothetical protein